MNANEGRYYTKEEHQLWLALLVLMSVVVALQDHDLTLYAVIHHLGSRTEESRNLELQNKHKGHILVNRKSSHSLPIV